MNDSLLPSRPLRALSAAASALWWLLLACWLVLLLAWGALHGWIVPRIGEYRPLLETQATRALGVPVRIGAVMARSEGLMPSFELRDVVLLDDRAREALRLARVVVALSPRSLWKLGFEQLYIEGPQLDMRRLPDGRLQVAGLDVSRGGNDERVADWFFRQKEVVIRGGAVSWTDEMRGAAPLVLRDIEFVSRNGVRRHAMRLDATPPSGWGQRFTLRGRFRQPLLSIHPGRWQDWTGQVYADLPDVELSQLRSYANLGVAVYSGRGALRAWADVDHGRFGGGTADLALQDLGVRVASTRAPLSLATFSGRLSGQWRQDGFTLETRGLDFQTTAGQRWPGGNLALSWARGQERRPEQGRLKADRLDLQALGTIASHLPLGTTTLAMLERHAPKGLVESLDASWQGPPEHLQKYRVRGRVDGFELASGAGLPGVRGANAQFEFDDTGGRARVGVQQGSVDLPGVFDEPVVPLDQFAADMQWRRAGEHLEFDAKGLSFANADAQGTGHVSWRTGAGAQRFPGVLDLQLSVTRANGTRVWRYLPKGIPKATRDYVREAVLAGNISDGRVRVRGDLHHFPFVDPRAGEFRISARVRDANYAFVPRSLTPGGRTWPALTQLSGQLLFEGNRMQVAGAQGRLSGASGLQVRADASIPNLATATVLVDAQARGPLPEQLALFNATPVSATIGEPLAQATANGPAELRLKLELPLAHLDQSRVQGSVTLAGNDVQIRPDVPPVARTRGLVSFSERGFALTNVQGRALGGDVRIEGGTRPGGTAGEAQIRLQGTASAEGLRQARELGFVSRLAREGSGSAAYAATLGAHRGSVDILVTSNLQGLGMNLPAPLTKAPDTSLPLRFELLTRGEAGRPADQLSMELGRLLSATYVRDLSAAEPQVIRGSLAVGIAPGESAPLPERGVLANINFASLDVDAWERVLSSLAPPASTAASAAAAGAAPSSTDTMGYLPTTLAVRARELKAQGRTLNNVVVGGSREGLTWRANVDAEQLNGYVEYRQASAGQQGHVMARLARLSIPATATTEVESLLSGPPAELPTLDVAVDDFELRGHRFGRLQIDAANRLGANGPEWRLNRLSLTMPEARFNATGNWEASARAVSRAARDERRRTAMSFRLDIDDAGALLARLGMKDVVRRGRGHMEGDIGWIGSPLSLDYPSMSGAMTANIESGQFLKADPGLAKLLSVLSLQTLPRRLSLDFRDVFSEGFAFDFVRGDVTIRQGIASTNNLQMKGVNAAVLMEGSADIARETQDLRVLVVPEINAGTASLVATVINPAVGLGTFLAQMFLREPLMRAATQEFHVDGSWADPRVTRINRRSEPPASARSTPAAPAKGTN